MTRRIRIQRSKPGAQSRAIRFVEIGHKRATPEERSRIVKDAGYDVSDDDVKRLRSEISDDDLEKVAGGDVGYDVWIGPLGTH